MSSSTPDSGTAARRDVTSPFTSRLRGIPFPVAAIVLVAVVVASLAIGAQDLPLRTAFSNPELFSDVVFLSRLPRTVALLLSGVALSIAGLIMQLLSQNKFVEPATAGTIQSATLGMLLGAILWPGMPVWLRILVASASAFAGTLVFVGFLSRIDLRSSIVVPLVGIMLGAVVSSITVYIAAGTDMLQAVSVWQTGNFATVIEGRYELLYLLVGVVIAAYLVADRFTIAGLGEDFATNVGLDYRRVMLVGIGVVAVIAGVTVSVVGALPFLGLIVPNIVSREFGDNSRLSIPWVAALGAIVVTLSDIFSRLVIRPYEIPVGATLGVVGAAVFLVLILSQRRGAR